MSITKKWVIIGFLLGVAIFLLSPGFQKSLANPGFWNLKEQSLYLTGSISMAYMVICMLISIRIESVSKLMGGLDKAYIVHKWAGIYAFVFLILHWAGKQAPTVLSALELLPPKIKSGGVSPISEFAKSIYELGNNIVEPAFYILMVVILVSLIKRVPYHIFRNLHKTIPVFFLISVFHAGTIQIKGQWFGSIGSYILILILAIGTVAAVISLFQLIGISRKVKATVTSIDYNKSSGLIDIKLTLPKGKFSYKAGQYVFLSFDFNKEPHPFSIASYDKDMKEIRIIIKELGDYTNKLHEKIKNGSIATIEGPYGSFTFEDDSKGQIWVAGGIGVTPFISRLEYMAQTGDGKDKEIDFFYSARGESEFKKIIEGLCEKTGVKFHYTDTSKDGRLCLARIKDKCNDLSCSTIWYCGPVQFCDTLKKGLGNKEIKSQLHYDNFDMR